jgi:hypothetical protein
MARCRRLAEGIAATIHYTVKAQVLPEIAAEAVSIPTPNS